MTGIVALQEDARLKMSSKTASFLDVASVDTLTAQEASLEVLEAVASLHISSSPRVQATHVAGMKLGSVCNLLGDQKALQEHENEMAEVSVVQHDCQCHMLGQVLSIAFPVDENTLCFFPSELLEH